LFSGSEDGTVGIWNPETSRLEKQIDTGQEVIISLEVSPDGKFFSTGARDLTVKLWKIDGTPVHTFKGHKDDVHIMKFVPEKHILVTAAEDGRVIIRDYESSERLALYDVGPQVMSGDLSTVDTTRAGTCEMALAFNRRPGNNVFLSDPEKGEVTAELKGHPGEVTAVAFSPDGLLASGDYKGTIMLWQGEKQVGKMVCPGCKVRNLVFSDDGKILAAGTYDGRVIIWDVESRRITCEVKG